MFKQLLKLCNFFGCVCDSTCVTGNIDQIAKETKTVVKEKVTDLASVPNPDKQLYETLDTEHDSYKVVENDDVNY